MQEVMALRQWPASEPFCTTCYSSFYVTKRKIREAEVDHPCLPRVFRVSSACLPRWLLAWLLACCRCWLLVGEITENNNDDDNDNVDDNADDSDDDNE